MIHCFEQCELDDERFELRRRGKPVKLEPKVFDVLRYLVAHPDRVVTKDELLEGVWTGVSVSESVLPKCIAAIRRAVGDSRARPAVIRTVHGRGYRFVAELSVRDEARSDGRGSRSDAATVPAPDAGTLTAGAATPKDVDADGSFVGRADLMARLRAHLEEAARGCGRTIVLLGEPGIGKTRTAEALAHAARRRGFAVLVGRAYEADTAPAFWPWIQILRAIAALPDVTARLRADAILPAELLALVPELDRRPPPLPPVPETEAARFRLFDGIATLLKRVAERQPLMLLLDDVHWADSASLRLLALLASEMADAPVLLVATCRDAESERDAAVADVLGAMARVRGCEWITLAGLPRTDTDALVAGQLEHAPSPAVLATIYALTSGNPFFVQEIARLLATSGVRAVHDVADMSQALPRRARDAIRRRLGELSPACRALLRVAAVMGDEVDASTLAAVTDGVPADVLRYLGEARQAHLLAALSGDVASRYVFHHALVRHALYDELDDADRVRWHGRVGAFLERTAGADPEAPLDAIAHHYLAAAAEGDVDRAVVACVRAARRAESSCAYERSAELYERARAALESRGVVDDARRAELLLAAGEMRAAAGERDAARLLFVRAAELARATARADLLARAALGYRGPAEMGSPSDPQTLALLDEALAAVGHELPVLRARLLARIVGTPPHSDRMATRARLSAEALALARPSGDATALRDALSARLWASLGPDAIAERLAIAHELLALGEREHSLLLPMLGHDAAFGAHLLRGDLDAAARTLAAYGEVARAAKRPAFLFLATFWSGSLALARGELTAAEDAFRRALEQGRGTVPYAHFMFAGQMYPLRYLRGEDDDAELAAIFFGEMMAVPYAFAPALRSALAFAHWLRGDRDAARAEFEQLAVEIERGRERDEHWLVTVDGLARLAVLFEDSARAALLYDLLRPYADLVVVHDQLRAVGDPVAAALGALASVIGRHDDAVAHYERAAVKTTAMGARIAAIHVQSGHARALTARARRGDHRRAAELEATARRAMAELGIRRNWLLDVTRRSPPK